MQGKEILAHINTNESKKNPKGNEKIGRKIREREIVAHIIKKENKKNRKEYERLKKIGRKIHSKEILAHINKSGEVTVSRKVPKRLRNEAAEHDVEEYKYLTKR
jgi:uncharacterized membrane protein YcaP (DUF421 family)